MNIFLSSNKNIAILSIALGIFIFAFASIANNSRTVTESSANITTNLYPGCYYVLNCPPSPIGTQWIFNCRPIPVCPTPSYYYPSPTRYPTDTPKPSCVPWPTCTPGTVCTQYTDSYGYWCPPTRTPSPRLTVYPSPTRYPSYTPYPTRIYPTYYNCPTPFPCNGRLEVKQPDYNSGVICPEYFCITQ